MTTPVWRGAAPLLLASTSRTRRALVEAAGLPVDVEAPLVDERALETALGEVGPEALARHLADAKALDVSRRNPDRIVLGADQILSLGRDTLSKPPDRAAARRQIARLSGRTHALVSAFALALAGEVVARDVAVARLTMRPLGEEEIDRYLSTAGEAALRSVGCYEIEALGVHLFDTIEGEHSAILGLPMLPLLAALRGRGLVAL